MDRAFIQFAGFTAGFTESFFSFGGAYSIVSSNALSWDWLPVIAYTAQLGNGVSATLSVEEGTARRSGANSGFIYGGANMPDVIANVRVDQAWGSAQIMGAVHQVWPNAGGGVETKWGYAVGGGFEIKTPQTGNPNNSLLVQGVWSKGAIEYTGLNGSPLTTAVALSLIRGATGPVMGVSDAYNFGTGTLNLTEAWSVYGGYRHYWTPMLRTGFSVGYNEIDNAGVANLSGVPDAELLQGHVSTIWSPVAGLDLSLDLVYTKLKTSGCPGPTAVCGQSEDIWTAWTRIRRNF
jgi:hypothetical protein